MSHSIFWNYACQYEVFKKKQELLKKKILKKKSDMVTKSIYPKWNRKRGNSQLCLLADSVPLRALGAGLAAVVRPATSLCWHRHSSPDTTSLHTSSIPSLRLLQLKRQRKWRGGKGSKIPFILSLFLLSPLISSLVYQFAFRFAI